MGPLRWIVTLHLAAKAFQAKALAYWAHELWRKWRVVYMASLTL